MKQFNVVVEDSLMREIKIAAATEDVSIKDWLVGVLLKAVARHSDHDDCSSAQAPGPVKLPAAKAITATGESNLSWAEVMIAKKHGSNQI